MPRPDNVTIDACPDGPRYVIGSGWWCSEVADADVNAKRRKVGSEQQRAVGFFAIWLANINRFAQPFAVVVVDSASPVKPDSDLREQVAWIELPFNARHATDHVGQWSGWLRSVMISAQYALTVEAEYFVYVEQDCLIKGDRIVEYCIGKMKTGLMFGDGEGTPQPVQQSFFLIHRDRIPGFLKNLGDLQARDSDLSPELKFVFASWRPFVWLENLGLMKRRKIRNFSIKVAKRFFFDMLPMGTGRTRPVPFDAPHYYFQHGSEKELNKHLEANVG